MKKEDYKSKEPDRINVFRSDPGVGSNIGGLGYRGTFKGGGITQRGGYTDVKDPRFIESLGTYIRHGTEIVTEDLPEGLRGRKLTDKEFQTLLEGLRSQRKLGDSN